MSRRALALVFALAAAPAALLAQAHPLVGRWSVTVPVGMRIEGDIETPVTVTAGLHVTIEGDSLVAMLSMPAPQGMPARPPRRLTTRLADGPAVFELRSVARIDTNGETAMRDAVSTFTLSANGDSLTGTILRRIEGADMPAKADPVTGTRVHGQG